MSEKQYDIETTLVSGIICNTCQSVLPTMTMAEHLDINNPLNICRTCELKENQLKRMGAVIKWESFLLTLQRSGKGKRTRTEWLCYVKCGASQLFDTEEKEYEYIGKFGRGIWSEEFLKKGFTKQEIEMIVEFAYEYGAFDY